MSEVVTEIRGAAGLITLDRPRAMNALSLDMIRGLTATLLAWADNRCVERVAVRGMGREGPFGTFCAGGDIRFFHQAVLDADWRLVDFFTEEYTLNHLIHAYPKPYVVFMDDVGKEADRRLGHGHLRALGGDTQALVAPVRGDAHATAHHDAVQEYRVGLGIVVDQVVEGVLLGEEVL